MSPIRVYGVRPVTSGMVAVAQRMPELDERLDATRPKGSRRNAKNSGDIRTLPIKREILHEILAEGRYSELTFSTISSVRPVEIRI